MAKAKKVKKAKKPAKTSLKKSAKKTAKKPATKKKKVLAIPKGYNSVTPYLVISGNADAALEFYKKAFKAKEKMRFQMPNKQVMHAELKIGDSMIMLADECPEKGICGPSACHGSPVNMLIYTKKVDEFVKTATKHGAKLLKPVEDMFYGDRTGVIQDPFGHTWTIATHIEDVSIAKMKKRAAEQYGHG
jgi:PhnB protein